MKTVGAFEAKTHLSRLLDEVARGETIAIEKHGKPVALLVPASSALVSGDDLVARFERFRAGAPRFEAREIRALIDEGRK